MRSGPQPSVDRLRQLLTYDEETGALHWRIARPPMPAGAPAGTRDSKGYLMVGIDRTLQRSHRVAWAMVHGRWPTHEIDHRNGIKDDNRIANLREATHKQNHENRRADARSASGFRGVCWDKSRRRWQARIEHHGAVVRLGRHDTLLDAVAARVRAERALFTHHREEC
jgi:hypothetical protein